jgi:hypothetical protein
MVGEEGYGLLPWKVQVCFIGSRGGRPAAGVRIRLRARPPTNPRLSKSTKIEAKGLA